jgi:hypothetical protein
VAQSAGLFSAQELLFKLGVLKYSAEQKEDELNKFLLSDSSMNLGYQVIIYRHGDSFEALQDIIGYRFKNMSLLIQAVTHKSFKEHFNTMKDH